MTEEKFRHGQSSGIAHVFGCSQFEMHHAARNLISLAALLASAKRGELLSGLQPPAVSTAQDVHRGSINSHVIRSMSASYRHFCMKAKRLLGQLRFRCSYCGHSICFHGTKYVENASHWIVFAALRLLTSLRLQYSMLFHHFLYYFTTLFQLHRLYRVQGDEKMDMYHE
jgi:hypothetical protein